MNTIDRDNIKKILEKRKLVLEDGGELEKDWLDNSSTSDLEELLKDYEDSKKRDLSLEIRTKVDQVFNEFSDDPEDNMIILWAVYKDEDGYICEIDWPLESINFDGFGHAYNKFAYPVGRELEEKEMKIIEVDYVDPIKELVKKLPGFIDIENFFEEDRSSINIYWCGVYAITKDYKLVSFIIRDDGMMGNESSIKTMYEL